MITVLAGGVGAAKLLAGLIRVVEPSEITAVVNTADDTELHGLHISPDLDTVTYTLAGAVDRATGWGLEGETWSAMAALDRYGGETWFGLGDKDLATHLYRTHRLHQGAGLHEVTREIVSSWDLGIRLLPVTDDGLRTIVTLIDGTDVSFQDYFVRLHHDVAVSAIRFEGAESAAPGPGVLAAITEADRVIIAPSNPIVSIGPLLAVPGIRGVLADRRDDCVAVSPIVGGAALKGPADRLMRELGHESTVVGVAAIYRDLASVLVIDEADRQLAGEVEAAGMDCLTTSTVMSNPEITDALARTVIGPVR